MRVLVAGGTGFIGRPFVDRLAEVDPSEILVVSRSGGHSTQGHVRHLALAWEDAHRHRQVLDFAPQVLVNMIGGTHPRSSVGQEANEIEHDVLPFFRLIDELEPRGLDRVVFCSSAGSIYQSAQLRVEKARADTPYCATKRSIEHYLSARTAQAGLRAVSLRISNPVGLVDRPGFGIVNHFSQAVIDNRQVEFVGDHGVAKDYVDLHDVTQAALSVVTAEQLPPGHSVLDVGSGWAVTAGGMHTLIVELAAADDRHRWASVSPRARGMVPSQLDLEPIRTLTGWEPTRDVLQAIRSVHDANLARCRPERP